VVAADAELTSSSVRLTLQRKSATDFSHFQTMPETHAAYAFTWGTLSAVLAYILVTKIMKGSGSTAKMRTMMKNTLG
jgi:cytochrome oxidase assembly protein ShyY1